MSKLLVVLCLVLVGCGESRTETRCIDGHVYRKHSADKFWVAIGKQPVECKL